MSITLTNAFDSLTRTKRNIGNLDNTHKFAWSDTVNEQIYNRILKVNPENYITEFLIDVVEDTFTYAQPTGFKSMSKNIEAGLFKTTNGTTFGRLRYDAETGTFTVGETVTGGTSAATGVISELHDAGTTGYFKLSSVSGTFEDDEAITDSSTGIAVVNGTLSAYINTNTPLDKTGQASGDEGWYKRGTNIILTPVPTANTLYNMRYIPKKDKFTALTETFVDIPTESGGYLEMITDLLYVQYEIVINQSLTAAEAQELANNIMDEFFGEIEEVGDAYELDTVTLGY